MQRRVTTFIFSPMLQTLRYMMRYAPRSRHIQLPHSLGPPNDLTSHVNNAKYVYEIIYVYYDLGFLRSCNEISHFSAIFCNSRTAVVDFSFSVPSGFISFLVCSITLFKSCRSNKLTAIQKSSFVARHQIIINKPFSNSTLMFSLAL